MDACGWLYLECFYFFTNFYTFFTMSNFIYGSYVLCVTVSFYATSNSESASVHNDMVTTLTPCAEQLVHRSLRHNPTSSTERLQSRRIPVTDMLPLQGNACGICSAQSGNGAGSSPSTWFLPVNIIIPPVLHTNIHSSSIWQQCWAKHKHDRQRTCNATGWRVRTIFVLLRLS